jgi:quercetin dioxygenase-like cupin family protein
VGRLQSGSGTAATGNDVNRKVLSKTDGGLRTVLVEAEIEAGVAVGRHTHPGIESAYVLEGGFELPIQGMETRMLKAGDAFQVPPIRRMPVARRAPRKQEF